MISTATRPSGKSRYKISSTYQKLLERYPLLPIKSEQDYERADEVLADLFGREDLSVDEARYLDSLIILITAYEDTAHDLDQLAEAITPLQALKSVMKSSGMSQSDLAKLLGTEASASMILSGKRSISKAQAKVLAKHFRVDAGLFI